MRRFCVATALVLFASATVLAQRVDQPRRVTRPQVPETLRILNQPYPELRVESVPFETVLQQIQEYTNLNISVRWEVLKAAGVEPDAPISIQARNLRLSQVLWMVLNGAGGQDVILAYRMSGNLLILSTEEDLGKEVITKVYDVADLMVRIENAERPQMQQGGQGLGQNSGGGGSLFQNNQQNTNTRTNTEPGTRSPEMEALIKVIVNTIEPQTWGGDLGQGGQNAPGHIEAYGNLLIVTNTILVHQRLGGYITE